MTIAMRGFEAFEVRAWQEGGLIIRLKSERPNRRPVRRHGKWIVAMAVSLAACVLPNRAIDGVATQAALHWNSIAPKIRAVAPLGGDHLPDRYWADLMRKMDKWKSVAESGIVGPEPIV
ncbi:MAG: hypothetical protein HY017_10495 [Betaproteobacteria bacterium]|nr:hypothetical protein [Betaproteobacteria bacterium]